MKKSLKLIFTILCLISASTTVYGQWTATGTDVNLTTTTNNVVIGPAPIAPATSTTLYLNNAVSAPPASSYNPTILTIDNNSTTPSGSALAQRTSQLNFNIGGINYYKLYYSTFPAAGTDIFHIARGTYNTGPGIHMSKDKIAFSNIYTTTESFGDGKYIFDGKIGSAAGINAGYGIPSNGSILLSAPLGYTLTNGGMSYFRDKVLIGTTSTAIPTSSYKLYVGGTAICEELIVKLQASWPDFVFSPQYKLKPLSEVKTYITKNSHLPDVPAACEIEEKGIATSEMLTIQMKKIEELTLYMIQMEERIKELESQNKALQK